VSGLPPRRRVLFIEDERLLRQSYERYFRSRFELAFAATGTEALVLVREFRPHLIVLDLGLPDTDGLEVLRRVRERNATLPVIVTTGFGHLQAEMAERHLTVSRFLLKPLGLDELAAAIDATA
jgi:DNA-binding response OmpR family regulator